MVQPKYNPQESLERIKLMMNYDTKKTLKENKESVNEYNFGTPFWGAASTVTTTGAVGGGTAASGAGSVFTSWPAAIAAISSPAAAGASVVALVGAALYWAYRNADNEDALRKTVEACNTGAISAGGEAQLMQDSLLGKEAHIEIGRAIYAAIEGEGTWNDMIGLGKIGGLGTNEEQIFAAAEKLSKGNAADICGVIFEYQGPDFVDDLAEDLDEADLSKIVASFRKAVSEYAGEGKVFPPNSFNISWYRQKFPCIFKTAGTVIAKSVGKDENGYTYIMVNGLRRSDGSTKKYRLRGDDGALLSEDGTKTSNAKLTCGDGNRPVTVTESRRSRPLIKEQGIDDSKLVFSDELLDVNEENWSTGKYDVPWTAWVRKFPCLQVQFANATPKKDPEGFTYFENKQPSNGKVYRMYSDGQIWSDSDVTDTGKKWRCAPRGGKLLIESSQKKNIREQIEIESGGGTSTGGGGTSTGGGGSSSYQICTGTYRKGCYGDPIIQIQRCLGLTPDGKWGNKTQAALESKFPQFATSFTTDDVSTICAGGMVPKKEDIDKPVNQVDVTNTDF